MRGTHRRAEHAEAVLRKAVSNVAHHAGADKPLVTISVDDDLVIDVTENGIGLPDTVTRSGLRNIQQRADAAGGTLSARQKECGGTSLVWTAPQP